MSFPSPPLPLSLAELNAADALIHQSNLKPSPPPTSRKSPPEESKTNFSSLPAPDTDSDTDQPLSPAPYPTDLIPLPTLPPRPSSRQSLDPTPPSFRHRTSIYVDAADDQPPEIFSTTFSPDSRYLAAGCGDGTLRVWTTSGQLKWRFNPVVVDALPVTCVRFRPQTASAFSSLQNVLMGVSADGTLSHYHLSVGAGKATSVIRSDVANQLYTAAYDPTALSFATAGRDATIRVYDEQTRQMTASLLPLSSASSSSSGHSNRIYALRYHPTLPVLFSAGWDNTVLVWDTRSRQTTSTLYGPHVCGDALDIHPDGRRLLTGSWRQSGAVEVWDWVAGKVEERVGYNVGSEAGGGGKAEMIYAATWGGAGGGVDRSGGLWQ